MRDSYWQIPFANMIVLMFAAVLFSGCGGSSSPEIVPFTVTVKTSKGEAINNVLVRFVPLVEGLDGNHTATGVTGDDGSCELSLPGKSEPGCCACEHKVLILEGPPPAEARGSYNQDGGAAIKRFSNKLKHRPLPKSHQRLTTTPLKCTPSLDNSKLEIQLK